MRYLALTLAVFAIGFLITCHLQRGNYATTNSQPQDVVTVLGPMAAILNDDTLPPVEASETQIKGKTGPPFQFRRAQFINDTYGWAMTPYSLYRTIDGGKTWERLPQEPEKDARFMAFFFVNESNGWLAILKQDFADHYGVGNSSVIMSTSDGGRTWNLQASFKDEIEIRDVRFLNENEGLAIGSRGLDNRPDRGELFVVGTSNGGKEWINFSGPANATFKNPWGVVNDRAVYAQLTSSAILMLTEGGRVMSTRDHGKSWNTVVILKDERTDGFYSSAGYYKLALDPKSRIRVLVGAMGDEGYWGGLLVDEHDQWTSYEITRTPILDAVFVSEKDVIASGLNVRRVDEKSKRGLKDAGIILRSFDGGKSWQSIYRSKTFETFFYLTKVKDNEFYAVSDTGTFLRFTLPQ